MVSCFWEQSCTAMYSKIKTSVCELLANVDIQLVSCYHCKSSYRKLSQKQYATRRTKNKIKPRPLPHAIDWSYCCHFTSYLQPCLSGILSPKPRPRITSAQGSDSKSRKVESNKGTLASELRFGLLSDAAVGAGWFFFKNVFPGKKGELL